MTTEDNETKIKNIWVPEKHIKWLMSQLYKMLIYQTFPAIGDKFFKLIPNTCAQINSFN